MSAALRFTTASKFNQIDDREQGRLIAATLLIQRTFRSPYIADEVNPNPLCYWYNRVSFIFARKQLTQLRREP